MENVEPRETMTAIEAVQITRNLLGDIALPAKHQEQINIICAAMKNLDVIKKMIEKELEEAHHADDQNEQGEELPG